MCMDNSHWKNLKLVINMIQCFNSKLNILTEQILLCELLSKMLVINIITTCMDTPCYIFFSILINQIILLHQLSS